MPDPRGQGEGDEGGEEGAPAGAVRKEHTWRKDSEMNSRNLFQKSSYTVDSLREQSS